MANFGRYELAAPLSFCIADEDLRNEITGGCGPGGVGDILVPDTLYFLSVRLACQIHDWCYGVWNDKKGFELSNNLFKNNMIRIIDQHGGNKLIKYLRKKRAYKYYLAVHYFGEPAFFDSYLKLG